MSHGKFSISSLLHTDFQNTSNYFSKNIVRNYLCPQGVVLGSKQMTRQNCRICNSQINRQYHLLWNQKCNSYTKEASLPLKRSPPGGDPYTAAFSPDPYTSLSPTTTTFSSSLESFASDLPSRGFSNQRQIENAQEHCTLLRIYPRKSNQSEEHTCGSVRLVVFVVESENHRQDLGQRRCGRSGRNQEWRCRAWRRYLKRCWTMNREKRRWKKKASSYLRLRIYNSCFTCVSLFCGPEWSDL